MTITALKARPGIADQEKLNALYTQFGQLLLELDKRTLPSQLIEEINKDISELNAISETDNTLRKSVKRTQTKIVKAIEKELKIVPKNYYRTLWMAVGMSAFGLPLGVALGLSLGNIGLLGIGLPIGMVIGIGVGTRMDQKALEEGRQLDTELKL